MSTDTPATDGFAFRAEPQTLRARSMEASITANDLEKSLKWYRDVVGFVVDEQYEREGKVVAVSLKAGDVRVIIGQDDGAKGKDRVKGAGFSLQLTTAQNIDDIATRIRDAGGTLDTEPTDMPWGSRVLRVVDPDGFKFTISSERPERAT